MINKLKEYYENNVVSLLFSIFGTLIIMYSFLDRISLIYFFISSLLIIVYYFLFGKVVELKRKGVILYSVVGGVIFLLAFFLISFGENIADSNFYLWAMGSGDNEQINFLYELASLFIVPFLFSSLSYYYSVKIVRMPMVFLIAFIARTIYIKSARSGLSILNYIFICLIIFLFIEKNLKYKKVYSRQTNFKLVLTTSICIVPVLFIISLIIPKPNILPKIPIFHEIRQGVYGILNFTGDRNKVLGDSASKNINESLSKEGNRLLYSFEGENPEYLIEKNYTSYKNNKWTQGETTIEETELYGYRVLDSEITKALIDMYKDTNSTCKTISELEVDNSINSIKLVSEGIVTKNMPHPPNVKKATLDNNESKLKIDEYDRLRQIEEGYFDSNGMYYCEYQNIQPLELSQEEEIMNLFTFPSYMKFIKEVSNDGNYSGILDSMEESRKVYCDVGDSISEKVKKLADEIVVGCKSDYEKAEKIQNYLKGSEYKYSLNIPKQRGKGDYIEYFILEGKTGYCVQFATAMTLMCRSVGVEARYVEGYLITEDNYKDGKYLVTSNDGHAFVEIYLPGYGWKVFDPTPSAVRENKKDLDYDNIDNSGDNEVKVEKKVNGIRILFIACFIFLAAMIIVLAFKVYLNKTKRSRYLKKVYKLDTESQFEELIKDSIRLLAKCTLTPYAGETLLKFSNRVDKSMQIGFENLIQCYYSFKYNGKEVSSDALQMVKDINSKLYEFTSEK